MKSAYKSALAALASRTPTIIVLECEENGRRAVLDVDYRKGVRMLPYEVEEHEVADHTFKFAKRMDRVVNRILGIVDAF